MSSIIRLASAALLVLAAASANAQPALEPSLGYLPPEHLEILKPDEITVEINLRGAMLKMISAFTGEEDPEFSELVADLDAVHVRSGSLTPSRLDEVRKRLTTGRGWLEGHGWEALVRVAEEGEEVSVYVRQDGDDLVGLAILALENEEATVVNLIGRIDPAQIGRLASGFAIDGLDDLPDLDVDFP